MIAAMLIPNTERPSPHGGRHRLRGPSHRVAGHTEVPGGTFEPSGVTIGSSVASSLFGDYVTACGLTLPRHGVIASTERAWLGTNSSCGDCFAT
jgi:hypothetical protein